MTPEKEVSETLKMCETIASAAYRLQQVAGGAVLECGNVGFACKDGMFYEEIAMQRILNLRAENAELRKRLEKLDGR